MTERQRSRTTGAPKAPVLRLIPGLPDRRQSAVSRDTIHCLERLLEAARAGQLQGLAYVAIHLHRNFSVNVCGEAHRSPVFARGALASLDDELASRISRG